MEIIEQKDMDEYKCPKCNLSLEFSHNELKENWKIFAIIPWYDCTTGNGWFECSTCKKLYLIKNYAEESESS